VLDQFYKSYGKSPKYLDRVNGTGILDLAPEQENSFNLAPPKGPQTSLSEVVSPEGDAGASGAQGGAPTARRHPDATLGCRWSAESEALGEPGVDEALLTPSRRTAPLVIRASDGAQPSRKRGEVSS
jgi:hypothetical protein